MIELLLLFYANVYMLFMLYFFWPQAPPVLIPTDLIKDLSLEKISLFGTVSRAKDAGGRNLTFNGVHIFDSVFRDTEISYDTKRLSISVRTLLLEGLDKIALKADGDIMFDILNVTMNFSNFPTKIFYLTDVVVGTFYLTELKTELIEHLLANFSD